MKISKNRIVVVLGLLVLLSSSVFLFQNCSPTASFGVANSERSAGQTFYDDPSTTADDLPIGARLKVVYPETTQVEQQSLKVKALIVIDNSGTMKNSQTNLSNNISNLLNELGKYDTQIQVVSSTFYDKDCQYRQACISTALFQDSFVYRPATITVNGQSVSGFEQGQELARVVSVPTYQLNSTTQTAAQFGAQITAITEKIKNFGTDGSDYESPFAVAIHQANEFFNEGDRGLIFIITDENDSHSISKLVLPTSTLIEKTTGGGSTQVPGYTFYVTRNIFSLEGGPCPSSLGATEAGGGGGLRTYVRGDQLFYSSQLCQNYVNTIQSSCTGPISCVPFTTGLNSTDVTQPLAPGQTVDQACAVLRNGLNPETDVLTKCISGTFQRSNDYTSDAILKYALGLTKSEIGYNYQTNPAPLKPFIDKFKSSVLSRLKDKYMISVSTNISGQQENCPLQGAQSIDTFFSSLKNYFSPRQYVVSSICETAGGSAEGLDKLTRDFLDVIKSNYLLGLSNEEKIVTAKIKIASQENLIALKLDQDYKIENDEIVIVNPAYNNFERIEILIMPK